MTKIRGVVERITYQNPENGYSVLRVAVKGYNDLVTVVGNLVDANVGSVLLIEATGKSIRNTAVSSLRRSGKKPFLRLFSELKNISAAD